MCFYGCKFILTTFSLYCPNINFLHDHIHQIRYYFWQVTFKKNYNNMYQSNLCQPNKIPISRIHLFQLLTSNFSNNTRTSNFITLKTKNWSSL